MEQQSGAKFPTGSEAFDKFKFCELTGVETFFSWRRAFMEIMEAMDYQPYFNGSITPSHPKWKQRAEGRAKLTLSTSLSDDIKKLVWQQRQCLTAADKWRFLNELYTQELEDARHDATDQLAYISQKRRIDSAVQ